MQVVILLSTYEIWTRVTERNARSTRQLQVTPEHDVTHLSALKTSSTAPIYFQHAKFLEKSIVFSSDHKVFYFLNTMKTHIYSQTAKYIVCTLGPKLNRKEEKPYKRTAEETKLFVANRL